MLTPEEELVALRRVRAWGEAEETWVASLPPEEQDLVYAIAALLEAEPVEDARERAVRPGSFRADYR